MNTLSTFQFADMIVRYVIDDDKNVGLTMIPASNDADVVIHREKLSGHPEYDNITWTIPAWQVYPLIHLKCVGDVEAGGYSQGRTMRNSGSTKSLKYRDQQVERDDARTIVTTTLQSPAGYRCEHRLTWHGGEQSVEITTVFHNDCSHPITLEMLSSFSLGGITPFDAGDAPDRLRAHRFRSAWSAEGRLDSQMAEELQLSRSWSDHSVSCERFGQVGTMPTRGFFPCAALEDIAAGVIWGAQLAWAGSWQMEMYRKDDFLCLSGGLADREFGHWMKTIAPGESFSTPAATLSTVSGDIDDLCHRLTAAQHRAADNQPAVEADLPIIFNEYCASWGHPTHEDVMACVRRLAGSQTKYLVIDAGWYKSPETSWDKAQGDWVPSTKLYPDGLKATADAIREAGFIPGLWFEPEVVGEHSNLFKGVDHLLHRDGLPITVSNRRFWDLNDPFAVDWLSTRMIDLLEECGFGYLKVDYNETLGIGADGAESLGEGLRRQVEGTYRLFDLIRERLPNLVIENCSSGGQRMEPSIIARTAMSSFSDAHETAEIPIIAAHQHRLILPRQLQVWAVLRKTDTDERIVYSLASTFLGRMCISGDITELSDAQWSRVLEAQSLYRTVWPVIKHGNSRPFGPTITSWRHPQGWQALRRVSDDGAHALIIIHTFDNLRPGQVSIPLPNDSPWQITDMLTTNAIKAEIHAEHIQFTLDKSFSGSVIYLQAG